MRSEQFKGNGIYFIQLFLGFACFFLRLLQRQKFYFEVEQQLRKN